MAENTDNVAVVDAETMLRAERIKIGERRSALNQRRESAGADMGLLGISLSGGGIRSGTFNLGILQGIARAGLLPCVDYLSTVSGGGYIGTWLHGLIKRNGGKPEQTVPDLERPEVHPHNKSHDPISFLRRFSSYLAPDIGLLSADTWVIAVIWLRNMLLNQLILVPFLACCSLLVFLVSCYSNSYAAANNSSNGTLLELALGVVIIAVVVGLAGTGAGTTAVEVECDDSRMSARHPWFDSVGCAVLCAGLLLIACFLLASASAGLMTMLGTQWLIASALAGVLAGFGFLFLQRRGKFNRCYVSRHGKNAGGQLFFFSLLCLIPGEVTAFLMFGIAKLSAGWSAPHAVAWATLLLAMAILVGEAIHLGLMGIDYPDNSREWLARVGAFLAIFAFGWALLFAITVFGPLWIADLAAWSWPLIAGLGAGWFATALGGVLAGKSPKTGGSQNASEGSSFMQLVIAVAPTAFVLGYLLLISFGLHQALFTVGNVESTPLANQASIGNSVEVSSRIEGNATAHLDLKSGGGSGAPAWILSIKAREAALLDAGPDVCLWAIGFFGLGALLVWLLPRRININEFSMHHFYKNRLVRCYLGAVRKNRSPSRLTGFDSCDDIALSQFLPDERWKYYGPFPIINTCLNLNTGSELAKRERKGISFTFTPLYSGYDPPATDDDEGKEKLSTAKPAEGGFRLTKGYGYPGGPDIGTCMAISGAAANPNSGYHTSPAMAFLLTIFNVRLGWWVGNTRLDAESKEPGPRHALMTLLSELLGQTDARSRFLNLSDGGHFENLGVYELVRRRCRYIIVGDGEQDENYTFESLGGAVRKCRADFGVEIDIAPRRIHPSVSGFSGTHCVVGRVRYPAIGGESRFDGWLLYLKASMTGDEPEDIAQYKSSHPIFPQQSTADQFFTESQFESYRKLGLHVWESSVQNMDPRSFDCGRLEDFFECLYRTWYPPTDIPNTAGSVHNDAYSTLVNKLSDPALSHLMDQVISSSGPANVAAVPQGADPTREFLYALELIQLMENVWADLRMSEKTNRENPANGGWITVFHHWTHQPLFESAWSKASYTFNPLFQQFYKTLAARKICPPSQNTCGDLPWDLTGNCP